ncbi:hypothetical protein [Brachybacterium alimentarium]|uniref:hypothetical protein n=1 Tax=Brachybacterium alimentarium TaxID=47845 RepID=UPI000DF34E29|nr:hypothetical protein [Brachybacterium alimentarium]RCS67745.1 hypothetical protein CIK68_14645 [Brachybacterium alimentarium]RCS81078.1 hypothetical protein CIK72_06625 [Brachybacterium alimentarium]RCS84455.1 hypothetical protein CIK67_09635 [Brachybacterium alimentarium]
MIDIDVARRLQHAGLPWFPAEGDLFAIDTDQLRDEAFMLSSMVIESAVGRSGQKIFRFNGTTEWALDSVEQHEALWIPREEQLRDALGTDFVSLRREQDGVFVVSAVLDPRGEVHEVRAPHAEDAYAGALLMRLTADGPQSAEPSPTSGDQ